MTTSDFNPYTHYQELMIPMRDGVRLAADAHFPVDDDGEAITDPAPVLLVRTSYDKSKDEWDTVRDYYPRHGYVFVNQDLRSRFKSEGDGRYYHTCNPWEGEDGFDTIEWIARQPWCNGKIGTLGSSHRGIVQTVAALHRPPHLTAQWVEQAPTNIYAHEAREGGAMCFHMAAAIHNHALDSHELRDNEEGVLAVAATFQNMREFLSNTPWKRGETALSHAPSLEETLFNYYTSGDYDEWWANENNDQTPYLDRHADIPVILTGGWWDPFAGGTADLFVDLTRRNKNPTHMVFGPWAHGTQRTDATHEGDVDFGPDAQWGMSKFNPIRRRWFDRWLKDEPNGVEDDPPILLFVMGGGDGTKNADGRLNHGGYWRTEQEWPLARMQSTNFYLHADGTLNTDHPPSQSEGGASDASGGCPTTSVNASITYTFDPNNPVPTLGGNVAGFSVIDKPEEGGPTFDESPPPGEQADTILQHSYSLVTPGPMHQREQPGLMACSEPYPLLSERPDVITFQTEPLTEDLEITGPIEVKLYVSSDAPDTDFTAKLLDIYPPNDDYPDGYHMNLCDSILRTRYRNSWTEPEMMSKNKVYPITVLLTPTSNLFKAGHRIRVDISSSNFPRFDINPNTGEPIGRHTHTQPAQNTLHLDKAHPSHIVLPLVQIP